LKRRMEEHQAVVEEERQLLLEAQAQAESQLEKFSELRNNLLLIQQNELKSLTTQINLGSDLYVQAKIPNTSRVYLNIGLGFHVEYSIDEALDFIDTKLEQLIQHIVSIKESLTLIEKSTSSNSTIL